jgi:hypothetical protein
VHVYNMSRCMSCVMLCCVVLFEGNVNLIIVTPFARIAASKATATQRQHKT